MHENVAMPDPMRLAGLIVPQVRPDGTVYVRLTFPAKRFRLVIMIVVMTEEPALTEAGADPVIAKSRNWNRAVVLWTRDPLVPVTIRV